MSQRGTIDGKRFEGEGLNFRAKLIGIDDVEEARGDKMCQLSMQKLKGAVKTAGEHKQRIVINVSLEGLKIVDGVSMAVQYTHAVHRISFIARDTSDSRAFGYVFGVGDGTHKFFAIKTEKAAEALVLTLRDLFQAVYETKKHDLEEAKKKQEEEKQQEEAQQTTTTEEAENADPVYQVPQNNTPVNTKEEKNLFDLEDELDNIEKQINSFDTMFETNPPDSSKPSTDPWASDSTDQTTGIPKTASSSGLDDLAGLETGFSASTPFPPTASAFRTTPSNPFGSSSQQFGATSAANMNQGFGQSSMTAPAFGQAGGMNQPFGQAPAGNQPFGQAPNTAFGQAPAANQPFGQAQNTAFGQAPAGNQPFGQAPSAAFSQLGGQPQIRPPAYAQPGAGQPGFGPATASAFPTTGGPFAPPGGAFPAQAGAFNNSFAAPAFPQTQPQQQLNLFPQQEEPDPNILAPMVLNEKKQWDETIEVREEKKDAFADLVNIGGTDPRKSPKAIFKEMSMPPKKTLNELKVDVDLPLSRTPSPAHSPGLPQASDSFQQNHSPPSQDPFPNSSQDPFSRTSYDPFDTAFDTVTSEAHPAFDPFMPTSSQNFSCDTNDNEIHPSKPASKPKHLTNGNIPEFTDAFLLPSPDEPPPPLPISVLTSPLTTPPPPPPRPKQDVNMSTSTPRPLPKPRTATPSVSLIPQPKSAKDNVTDSTFAVDWSASNDLSASPVSTATKTRRGWDPFDEFDNDLFNDSCHTAFDSST